MGVVVYKLGGEKVRLIDADAEIKELEKMKVEGEVFTTAVNFAKIILREAQTIDAVDVVRCKDCKHYRPEVESHDYALGYCPFIKSHLVMNKGFCAWAKRRENEAD